MFKHNKQKLKTRILSLRTIQNNNGTNNIIHCTFILFLSNFISILKKKTMGC